MITTESTLRQTWLDYQKANPQTRIRDAAAALGVSEAELLATDCGASVTRLQAPEKPPGWGALIQRLPALGRVMALTRNEHCVHERKGVYSAPEFFGTIGTVAGPDIDLRFFLNHWHFGFAVVEETRDGLRRSLQFFDGTGTAVHKIYLQPESDAAAFDAIVNAFKSADQGAAITVTTKAAPAPELPDSEIDIENFRAAWRGMQDTHEFYVMLKKFRLGRLQALRLAGEDFARKIAPLSAEPLLRAAAAEKLPIMVFTGNEGMIQIHTGPVEKIVPFGKDGEWINVLDDDFNLHLRQHAITEAWVTLKPTRDGYVTSVECYEAGKELVVQFFGKRKPGEPELGEWRALVAGLR